MPQFAFRRPKGALALMGIAIALAAIVGAQAPPLDPTETTAFLVLNELERHHLARPTVNDEIAKKWCRNYLETLDPFKVYFLKADVDEFLAKDTTLDDKLREGNVDFAKTVFDRLLKRRDERLATALELLKEKPDFTVDESIADDPKTLDYPANADEARDRLRKQIKLERLQLKINKVEDEAAVKQLTIRHRDQNRFWHQFDQTDILEFYLTALTTAIDPHTNYMGAKTVEDLMGQQLHLTLDGIGASLTTEDGFPVVKEIVPGGAADKDGRLQPEDKIVGIERDKGEVDDFIEKKLSDVVRKIRGPRGTKVRIIVQPHDSKERKVYELTRQKIELNESRAKGQIIETKAEDGKVIKIGMIELPSFYGDTVSILRKDPGALSATQDCRNLLRDFKAKGVNAVVIDLRRNGGGLLNEAISLSGLFIDEGPVVQVRQASGTRHLDDDDPGTAYDGPLAVVISHQSASASEIFAGVIKDYGRGLIIGDSSTFGKGTVQSIVPLNERLRNGDAMPDLGALKLTIQQFYRANGESTQIRGVKPDVHIPSIYDKMENLTEGKMDSALKFDKVPPLPHDQFNWVPADLVARLDARSVERRKANEKFRKEEARIQKFVERKARHAISLNEEKFRAEVLADDEEDGAIDGPKPKDKPKKRPTDRPEMEPRYYYDEILAIVADYVTLGSKALATAPVHVATD